MTELDCTAAEKSSRPNTSRTEVSGLHGRRGGHREDISTE